MADEYMLPDDAELLRLFPYEPSGEYMTNRNVHDNQEPLLFWDAEAERESHLRDVTEYIQHIVDQKKISLQEALELAASEYVVDEEPFYLRDPDTWDRSKKWYLREESKEDQKQPEACPGPCQRLTYTSPVIDLQQSYLPIPMPQPVPPSIILVDENGIPVDESHRFRDRHLAEVERLKQITGDDAQSQGGLTPEQRATFEEKSWVQEEAKLFLDSQNVQTRKFFLQNRRVLLTYKTHIDKEELRQFLRNTASAPDAVIDIAHETGDPVCPYNHTHVVVDFGKRFQSTNARIFDYQNIHPHVSPITNETRYNKARHYLSKEDPECSYLFNPNIASTFASRIWNCATVQEALRQNAHNPSDVSGIVQLFTMKATDVTQVQYEEPSFPWQFEFLHRLSKPVSTRQEKREITWIYDEKGTSGKSQLCLYLAVTQPNKWYIMKGISSDYHVSTIVKGALESGWTSHGIIFDIPRETSNEDLEGKNVFSPLMVSIESIKDGFVTSYKFRGQTSVFNQGWVVVFSNGLPDVDSVTHDRWNIHKMHLDKTMTRMTPEEARTEKIRLVQEYRNKKHLESGSTNAGLFPV